MNQVVDIRRYEKNRPSNDDMVWISGGTFLMGSGHRHVDAAPARRVHVDDFWIDRYPVTNERFRAFVKATGYVTDAERDPARCPGIPPDFCHAGSLVFVQPHRPIERLDMRDWWLYMRGAQWRHPYGPHSSLDDLNRHPVVHVTYRDAEAFARWEGKELPTEAQWEWAARGGQGARTIDVDEDLPSRNSRMANTWSGKPCGAPTLDGCWGTSPVDESRANGYGLHDMIGNVWQWTVDDYTSPDAEEPVDIRGIPREVRVGRERGPYKVLKGGSYLRFQRGAECRRMAARSPQRVEISTSDVGFRCVLSVRGSCRKGRWDA